MDRRGDDVMQGMSSSQGHPKKENNTDKSMEHYMGTEITDTKC